MRVIDKGAWATFDDFLKHFSSINVITINDEQWENSFCTCKHAQKHYYCNHILLVASRLELLAFDDILMDLPLDKKASRGRKSRRMPSNCLSKPKTVLEVDELPITNGDEDDEDDAPVTSATTKATKKRNLVSITFYNSL
jgi:hypothetical protein